MIVKESIKGEEKKLQTDYSDAYMGKQGIEGAGDEKKISY